MVFPIIVVLALLVVFGLAVRLDRRLSRAASGAGPWTQVKPDSPGQRTQPWELELLDDQIRQWNTTRPGDARRAELADTVNRLVQATGVGQSWLLSPSSKQGDLEKTLGKLEEVLSLSEHQVEQDDGVRP